MTSITAEQRRTLLATRDLSVDLVRVCCVLAVVVLHSLMLGLVVQPDGGIGWRNVVQAQAWFPVASWFGQLMPLFFLLGGFAGWQGWASVERRGGAPRDFIRPRVLRLGTPAVVWYLAVGGLVWLAVALGLPVPLAQLLAGGLGMPLWFLAAYLICQALVPFMIRVHRTHRVAGFAVPLVGCLVVDAMRYSTGASAVGLLNLLLVWPLVQQVGFLYADGTLLALRRRSVVLIAALAFTGVGLLGTFGPYSADMLDDLNPPTAPLVLIGVGQVALFVLAKPALDDLMRRRIPQAFVGLAGTRLMTIYLWHLLVVILVAAIALVAPDLVPAAGTSAWWWTRIPADLVVFAVLLVISLGVARFERGPRRVGPAPSTPLLILAVVAAIVPPFWAMQFRLDLAGFVWGAVLLSAAALLARGRVRN